MKTQLLYDIKPLEVIPDNSFENFTLLIIGLLCCGAIIFLTMRFYLRRKSQNITLPQWKSHLLSLDLNDTKRCAYTLTKWGVKGVETEEQKRVYCELLIALSPYKYKKNVPPFDDTTRSLILTFVHEVADV